MHGIMTIILELFITFIYFRVVGPWGQVSSAGYWLLPVSASSPSGPELSTAPPAVPAAGEVTYLPGPAPLNPVLCSTYLTYIFRVHEKFISIIKGWWSDEKETSLSLSVVSLSD